MSLGDQIKFDNGSYEIRGIVDDRFVVRIRDRKKNKESYKIWTQAERASFDLKNRARQDQRDRNAQIYERRLSGETFADLAKAFHLSVARIRAICMRHDRKERSLAHR